ncbi:hypothetical protein [Pseudomonas aeruginosa]|uniref:hypothetical protein n=1 Tax=Pseudomonas aeruginosa TaxID=287 RepID=UPI0035563E42
MTKANECTCPSGDGSLRHPCPAHPAAEQAGGDERAAFRPAQVISYRPGVGEVTIYVAGRVPGYMNIGDTVYVSDRAPVEQPSAALAQPPVSDPLMFACKSLAQITSSDGSGHADIALAVLRMAGVSTEEREQLVNGWRARRAWSRSPTQAEQAEAERPEVVARVVHSNPVVLDQCAPLNANDELMTVAQHAASVARWAEMFNRVEQERDAALARVASLESKLAELEKQDLVDVPGPDEIHQMAFEEGQPADDGDGYLFSAEEFDLFVQRLLDSCAAPVAQAQHSVPEGWMLVECGIWTQEQVDEMQKTVTRFRNSEFVDDRALAMAVADAGQCKAPEISLAELLAAAPGKEVGHE